MVLYPVNEILDNLLKKKNETNSKTDIIQNCYDLVWVFSYHTDIKLLFVDVMGEQQEIYDVVSSRPTFPSPPLARSMLANLIRTLAKFIWSRVLNIHLQALFYSKFECQK